MSLSKPLNIPLSQITYPPEPWNPKKERPWGWFGPEPIGYNRRWKYNEYDNSIQFAHVFNEDLELSFFYDYKLEDYYSDTYPRICISEIWEYKTVTNNAAIKYGVWNNNWNWDYMREMVYYDESRIIEDIKRLF